MTDAAPHDPSEPARLVVVGAGPRAVMLLERLLARETASPLEITLIDPYPPGAGRIWRADQSPLLKLNSMAQDVTVFTDETCTIEGPVRPGPTLIAWAESVRDGMLPEVEIDDAGVRAEVESLRGDSFPTRRLQSSYLDWFWRTTVAGAPRNTSVRWVQATVTGLRAEGDGYAVHLDRGAAAAAELEADLVVYAVGHNGREPADEIAAMIAAADREQLVYVPPAFTADADLSALAPGEDVIVRGMGLAAVDLVVLLAEGRGGRFHRGTDDVLRYEPSGREPRLHIGSRRGVPYRSKVSSVIQGDPPRLHVLTPSTVQELVARPGSVDFTRDVWPLIAQELVWGHYRELFTGHPDRVTGTWGAFTAVLRDHAGDTDALRRAAEEFVPDPLDRFDVPALDRPLGDEVFASDDHLQRRIRAHIRDDLTLRTTQERSSAQAVFIAILLSFLALADVPPEKWSARSRAVDLPVTWHTFFSYVASGPPAHRLEELIALADAGVVRFLGPDVQVRVIPERGFVASSPRVPGETVTRALVDAWLPGSGALVSQNAALRDLATGLGREFRVADASFAGSLGRIETDADGRVIAPDGSQHERLFAIGAFTSLTEAGAFTRPKSDSLSLRQTDRVAGAIAQRLRALAAAEQPGRSIVVV
ncbi:FAD/NAD(P)-binding protein [Microbacterium rhizomatis]|uniref:FAD/NAD(P)-binding protein n=1 Tax=Microbacterium rhizomatis TaxID=1631477 RepID=A0A5J5J5M6_9MICO|nr:FAD/NAD(P)-binding protein [Microbacterium rhizomatis]KAA9111446.1 FAD/NAD(P)-binding protein [Microbacterium rhizomatis]